MRLVVERRGLWQVLFGVVGEGRRPGLRMGKGVVIHRVDLRA